MSQLAFFLEITVFVWFESCTKKYVAIFAKALIYIYHMTLLLFSGQRHIINTGNTMTTRYITLSAGTCNVMTTSVTTMQIFMEINKL